MSKDIEELQKNWNLVGAELKSIIQSVNIVFETLTKIMKTEDEITLESTNQMKEAKKIMEKSNDLIKKMSSRIKEEDKSNSRQDL